MNHGEQMKLIVIHNPNAGDSRWTAERVESMLRAAGHSPRIVSAKGKWRKSLEEPADAYVAAGGDGLVHKVIHALQGRDAVLAILPIGTANNVAHGLGYTVGEDPAVRVGKWPERERALQIATVERAGKRRLLLEVAGVGAFANMMAKKSGGKKSAETAVALLGIRRRFVKTMFDTKPFKVTATVDAMEIRGEYLLLECLNLPYFAGRIRLAPHETPESPTVTLCAVTPETREAFTQWIATGEGDAGEFAIARGATVRLDVDEIAHVDGSRWPAKAKTGAIRIGFDHRAVRVWV